MTRRVDGALLADDQGAGELQSALVFRGRAPGRAIQHVANAGGRAVVPGDRDRRQPAAGGNLPIDDLQRGKESRLMPELLAPMRMTGAAPGAIP